MNRICVVRTPWRLGGLVRELEEWLRRVVAGVVAWAARRLGRTRAAGTDLYVATYAVLLEILYADADPTTEQRRQLEGALRGQLGLRPRAGCALLREAELARVTTGTIASIRLVAESYSMPQKVQLVRIMQGLAELDGVVTRRERYLIRKLSTLLRIDSAGVDESERPAYARVS